MLGGFLLNFLVIPMIEDFPDSRNLRVGQLGTYHSAPELLGCVNVQSCQEAWESGLTKNQQLEEIEGF
jgi:hypothetical protein